MRAALVPAGVEHEVVDDQLATTLEQLCQRPLASPCLEGVLLGDRLPGQGAPLSCQIFTQVGELLLPGEERSPRLQPICVRYDLVLLHPRPRSLTVVGHRTLEP